MPRTRAVVTRQSRTYRAADDHPPYDRTSRIFFIVLISIFGLSGLVYAGRNGSTVRVYCEDCNITPQLDHLSTLLASKGIEFKSVSTPAQSDVAVRIVPTGSLGEDIAGVTSPWSGNIELDDAVVRSDFSYLVILHEILHAAGCPHESRDEESIMQPGHAQPNAQLRAHHVRALRRLDGITMPERIVATVVIYVRSILNMIF